jgi:hypothetical protein
MSAFYLMAQPTMRKLGKLTSKQKFINILSWIALVSQRKYAKMLHWAREERHRRLW